MGHTWGSYQIRQRITTFTGSKWLFCYNSSALQSQKALAGKKAELNNTQFQSPVAACKIKNCIEPVCYYNSWWVNAQYSRHRWEMAESADYQATDPQFQFLHNYIFFTYPIQMSTQNMVENTSQADGHWVGSFCRASGWQWLKHSRRLLLMVKMNTVQKVDFKQPCFKNALVPQKNKFCSVTYCSSHLHSCKGHLVESQCDIHLLVSYLSRTTIWSRRMSMWRFCLLKLYKSLRPLSYVNTNPHIKMTHS